MSKLIDTHCHLNDSYFLSNEELLSSIINNMEADNLQQVFVVGYDMLSCKNALKLAEHKNVYAILGMHPNDSEQWNQEFEEFLLKNASHKKVIAIGEIGLDYHYDVDKDVQKQVLIKQLELANKVSLPIVLHNRESIGDMITILKEHKHLINNGGVVHCFNESYESYLELKKFGFKFSFGGAITFKNAKNAKPLLERVELTDILLETDCPYLTPEPLRGKERNQPKYVMYVAEKIADFKNLTTQEIIDISTQNALSVFGKVTHEA